jgi:hypothetical protein
VTQRLPTMAPTAEEAAQALREIESIRTRSAQLRAYRYAAPHLILWGIFWVIGYCASDAAPDYTNRVWLALTVLWLLLYLVYFSRSGSGVPTPAAANAPVRSAEYARLQRRQRLRFLGLFAVAALMIVGTALIMQPQGIEMGAYVPLLVASVYIGAGLWGAGSRYVMIGAALAVLALCGYLLLRQYFLLLMAFGGGGALILTGLWLRHA